MTRLLASRFVAEIARVYPIELCRALVITWLFSGLRNNEIFRLRLVCIRWQRDDATVPGTGELLYATAASREGKAQESEEANTHQGRFQASPEDASEEAQMVEKEDRCID
jgi:hypothetical protein